MPTGRLTDPEEFGNIVVKVGPQRQLVRVRDVARVELGAKSFDVTNRFDDKVTVGLAIFVLPDPPFGFSTTIRCMAGPRGGRTRLCSKHQAYVA